MAADLNKVILIGRLTRDAEYKVVNQTSVANFSLAVGRVYVQNGEKKEESHFFDCVAWGKLADIIKQYTKKGKQICVEGRLQHDRWEKDGQKFSRVKIFVETMQLLGSPAGDSSSSYNQPPPSYQEEPYSQPVPDVGHISPSIQDEDDIF